jgi:RimJ/RimL family protein N-acetyltransferase
MTQSIAPPTLTTERLTLRPLSRNDSAPMTRLADDPGVARMTTSIPHPFNEDMAEGFIARMAAADATREIVLAVDHRQNGFAGVIGFHPKEGISPELGYWIGRPFWGSGYMTEAVTAVLAWVGADWRKRVLSSGHFADNDASSRVLIKAGFLYTGEVEWRYSVARGEEAATRMMVWLP